MISRESQKIEAKKGIEEGNFIKQKKRNTESIIPPQRYEKCCFFYSIRDIKQEEYLARIIEDKKRIFGLNLHTQILYYDEHYFSFMKNISFRHHLKYFGGFSSSFSLEPTNAIKKCSTKAIELML
ncbi:hypothetical protein ACKWTF_001321 [Chironomus riparius]